MAYATLCQRKVPQRIGNVCEGHIHPYCHNFKSQALESSFFVEIEKDVGFDACQRHF